MRLGLGIGLGFGSLPQAAAGGSAPVNLTVPTIAGDAEVGQTLTATTGTWEGEDSLAWQWQREVESVWTDIEGATSDTYEVTEDDEGLNLRVKQTATNGAGSTAAYSEPVGPTLGAPNAPPLDAWADDIGVALSVGRLLLSSYGGPLIRVRRDSDDEEEDFGAGANGLLDEAAVQAFVGVGNGYIRTIYDQSPFGRHASRDYAAAQMQVIEDGATITDGVFAVGRGGDNYVLSGSMSIWEIYGENSCCAILRMLPPGPGEDNRVLWTSDNQVSLYAPLSNGYFYWDYGTVDRATGPVPSGWHDAWHWVTAVRHEGFQAVAVDGLGAAENYAANEPNEYGAPLVYGPYESRGSLREMVVWNNGANHATKLTALMI